MDNCNTGITIPNLLPTEPCNGNYLSTDCIASPNANSALDLPIGATQTQTNAAITAAILHKEEQIQSIITDISNIPLTDGSETKVTAGTNVSVTGNGTITTPYIVNSIDTTYSAGSSLSLVGTTFNNTAPDQTVTLTQGGATTITGTYPNFTISSTDTNTIADGSETKINSGTNTTITGVGTIASPYIVNSTDTRPYKVYTALLSQTGTDAPTAIVLENTLGIVPIFTYGSIGIYQISAVGTFTINKVFTMANNINPNRFGIAFSKNGVDAMLLHTFELVTATPGASANNVLSMTEVEIRVYN